MRPSSMVIEQLEQEGVVQVLRSPISLAYQVARVVDPADVELITRQVSSEVLTRTDGVMLVLFSTPRQLRGFQRDNSEV